MSVANGIPDQQGGVWVGAMNFEDLAPGAGLPAGWSALGGLLEDGVFSVGAPDQGTLPDDLTQTLKITPGTNGESGGVINDAFDAVWGGYGEILLCAWLHEDDGNLSMGPSVGMGGITNGVFKAEYGGLRQGNAVAIELATYEIINGGLGTVYQAGNVAGMTNSSPGEFKWLRIRLDDAGGGNTRFRAQAWSGQYEDDPGGWTRDTTQAMDLAGSMGASCRSMETNAPDNDYDIAFISFTNDPDTVTAPAPSEVLEAGAVYPPSVTVTELQGTWIEATGSAYTTVG